MRVWTIVPWRDSGDESRQRSHDYVTTYLMAQSFQPIDCDTDDPDFSRAAAKNSVIHKQPAEPDDVLMFHDADMVLPPENYDQMINLAHLEAGLVVGFSTYRALGIAATRSVLAHRIGPFRATTRHVLESFSLGGVVAVQRSVFESVGGYDERFQGWGCEDFAFSIACQVVTGVPARRVSGPGVHLWHPHASPSTHASQHAFNGRLLAAYNALTGPEALAALRASSDFDAEV